MAHLPPSTPKMGWGPWHPTPQPSCAWALGHSWGTSQAPPQPHSRHWDQRPAQLGPAEQRGARHPGQRMRQPCSCHAVDSQHPGPYRTHTTPSTNPYSTLHPQTRPCSTHRRPHLQPGSCSPHRPSARLLQHPQTLSQAPTTPTAPHSLRETPTALTWPRHPHGPPPRPL